MIGSNILSIYLKSLENIVLVAGPETIVLDQTSLKMNVDWMSLLSKAQKKKLAHLLVVHSLHGAN